MTPEVGLVDSRREPRSLRRIAWAVCALAQLGAAVGVALAVESISVSRAVDGYVVTNLTMAVTFAAVGGLVAGNRPRNPVGWLFLAYGVCFAVAALAGTLAMARAASAGDRTLRTLLVLMMGSWPLGVGIVLPLLVQLFPTGRPVSSRWKWLIVPTLVSGLAFDAQMVLSQDAFTGIVPGRTVPPLVSPATSRTLEPLWTVATLLLIAVLVASVVALVVRFRRSRGLERLQLTWLVWAVVIFAVLNSQRWITTEGPILFLLTIPLIPIAAAVAILRHDLYDIHLIVNRSLVYGLLTGVLGLGYAGAVLILGQLFGGIGAEPPSWTVAGATLAVAALFRPLRRRIQDSVDRRFNRRRYDAARTIEAFHLRLQAEIDVGTLTAEFPDVVHRTVQPTAAALWLRPSVVNSQRTDGLL